MRVLVTGGAGFIGSSASKTFLAEGHQVGILENFSRPGSRANLEWIRESGSPEVYEGTIVDSVTTRECIQDFKPDAIVHLAAQVAVTLSVDDPRHDFETNAVGTFNLLEATRIAAPSARFIFASTNKVYGDLEYIPLSDLGTRYEFQGDRQGINETTALDFHSPYGCSKGAADAYVTDYSRIYGLRTTVFRQSCIYGSRQFGIEDQGWIAWFIIAALTGRDIKVFGDGKQVRDALHVDDLVRLYGIALNKADWEPGQVFNVGGGPSNTLSVLELLHEISARVGRQIPFDFFETRQGDQKIFVSDNSKALTALGWEPQVSLTQGLDQLFDWIQDNLDIIRQTLVTAK